MDTPGITVRPLRTMHGVDEFCEVYFDDVVIGSERMLGKPGDGWRLAMDLLPYERSTCFWQGIAYLYTRSIGCSPTRLNPTMPTWERLLALHTVRCRFTGHPTSAGRRGKARARHVDRQGVAGDSGTAAVRHRP